MHPPNTPPLCSMVELCIELKMGIIDLLDSGTLMLVSTVSVPANFNLKDFSNGLFSDSVERHFDFEEY